MLYLNLGCDYSDEHLQTIRELVEFPFDAGVKIASVYGSPRDGNPFGSVRPSKRETKVSADAFRRVCETLRHELGVEPIVTLNSLFPHDKQFGLDHNIFMDTLVRDNFVEYIKRMDDHVGAWIVSHPGVMELLHSKIKSNLKIITSTIMNVHTIPQVEWIKNNWPKVIKVCPALFKNRDFDWLKTANNIIELELLANEFCTIGGIECEGLYRQACYEAQSMEISDGWNPMLTCCIEARRKNPEAWLMARFILPQWMYAYEKETGVNNFKITGRTHKADYLKAVGGMYLQGLATGNLLSLWGQLQATLNKNNWDKEQRAAAGEYDIPINRIESMIRDFRYCDTDGRCGYTCKHCANVIKGILK